MTTWDKIYEKYRETGKTWTSLEQGPHPLFISFLNETIFHIKHALDIGCGDGRYMLLLKEAGFNVEGMDSSETAIEMAKEKMPDEHIEVADMYTFDIPERTYDLIISISTIHHGTKDRIRSLVDRIHSALLQGGRLFITLPDYESAEKWDTFKDKKIMGDGTYAPMEGSEKGLLHTFYRKPEIEQLMEKFRNVNIQFEERGRWFIFGTK